MHIQNEAIVTHISDFSSDSNSLPSCLAVDGITSQYCLEAPIWPWFEIGFKKFLISWGCLASPSGMTWKGAALEGVGEEARLWKMISSLISQIDFEDFRDKASDVSKQPPWKMNGFLRLPRTAFEDFLELNQPSPRRDSYSCSLQCGQQFRS